MSEGANPRKGAALMAAAVVLLVGGSVAAALVRGAWGTATVVLAFVAYLFVFSRGLRHFPVDWQARRKEEREE